MKEYLKVLKQELLNSSDFHQIIEQLKPLILKQIENNKNSIFTQEKFDNFLWAKIEQTIKNKSPQNPEIEYETILKHILETYSHFLNLVIEKLHKNDD